MATASNDGKAIRDYLEECDFHPTDGIKWIKDQENPNEFVDSIKKMQETAKTVGKVKEKSLFFIYYSGHGALISGKTVGYTLTEDELHIEDAVRRLASYKNTYVIALLDCCREVQLVAKGGNDTLVSTAGQFCIIHAVGPTKKAVSVRATSGVSEV